MVYSTSANITIATTTIVAKQPNSLCSLLHSLTHIKIYPLKEGGTEALL